MRLSHKIAVIWLVMALNAPFAYGQGVDMDKIAMIESSGCRQLVGDNGKALGCYQLHSGVVMDYNRAHKTAFKHKDVMNKAIGLRVADWYMNKRLVFLLNMYKIPVSNLTLIASYNWGIGNVKKWYKNGGRFEDLPRSTRQYYKKYVAM
jgi:hypothetical protein